MGPIIGPIIGPIGPVLDLDVKEHSSSMLDLSFHVGPPASLQRMMLGRHLTNGI